MSLTDQQIERYARHILLPEIGGSGQAKIRKAKVLVIGAGGLSTPIIQYLTAAGIGTIGLIDDDIVELSNLQRQVMHSTLRIGMKKVLSAKSAPPSAASARRGALFECRKAKLHSLSSDCLQTAD